MHLPLARPRSPAAQCTVGTASLSVIIPAYDEAERLPRTLEESLAHLSTTRRGPWEIIVVDDGSHDSTCELVAARLAAEPRLRLLSSGRGANRGKGAGLAAGAAAARGDLLLLLDATPLSALPALERRVGARGCEMAVGCRAAALAARPAARRLMGVVFAALASTCVRGVPDTQCGFKLLSRRAARELFPSLQIRGWAYDVQLLALAQASDCPRLPEITRDHPRSHEITRDHPGSPEITRDRTRSHEITRDHQRLGARLPHRLGAGGVARRRGLKGDAAHAAADGGRPRRLAAAAGVERVAARQQEGRGGERNGFARGVARHLAQGLGRVRRRCGEGRGPEGRGERWGDMRRLLMHPTLRPPGLSVQFGTLCPTL